MAEPSTCYQRRAGFLPPGSDDARVAGCICAVLDNNHGRYPVQPPDDAFPDGIWWVTSDCPLHGTPGPNEAYVGKPVEVPDGQ